MHPFAIWVPRVSERVLIASVTIFVTFLVTVGCWYLARRRGEIEPVMAASVGAVSYRTYG
jgi:hypothetical protein